MVDFVQSMFVAKLHLCLLTL